MQIGQPLKANPNQLNEGVAGTSEHPYAHTECLHKKKLQRKTDTHAHTQGQAILGKCKIKAKHHLRQQSSLGQHHIQ